MASPKPSSTRRVLGDINININTPPSALNSDISALDMHNASSVASIQKDSYISRSSNNALKLQEMAPNSSTKIRRENREETHTPRNLSRGKTHQKIYTSTTETRFREDKNNPEVSLSTHGTPALASQRKRLLLGLVDVRKDSDYQTGQKYSAKKQKIIRDEKFDTDLSGETSAYAADEGAGLLFEYVDKIVDSQETVSVVGVQKDAGRSFDKVHEAFHAAPQTQLASVFLASSSSSSVEDVEDTSTFPNVSQTASVTIPDDSILPSTVSTISNLSSSQSKSKPLSQQEIRQKSQTLRLRLSLANYKVKTNQIDTPLSRLEIRSTGSNTSYRSPSLESLRARLDATSSEYGRDRERRCGELVNGTRGVGSWQRERVNIPEISLQRPSPLGRDGRGGRDERNFLGRGEVRRFEVSKSASCKKFREGPRRDSAISCTSLGSNTGAASESVTRTTSEADHAHPILDTEHRQAELNIEGEVERRRESWREQNMGVGKENMMGGKKPILERQKLGIANPPFVFAQPVERVGERVGDMGRNAAAGLVGLSLGKGE